eukprot:jgi/Psemu1/4285/gm1.4285_g
MKIFAIALLALASNSVLGTQVDLGTASIITGDFATISGGFENVATGDFSTVGGGNNNKATNTHTTVHGGSQNEASGITATVIGGSQNLAKGLDSTIFGGYKNQADSDISTVVGGKKNIARKKGSTVGGGKLNTANLDFSVVAGGTSNTCGGETDFCIVSGGHGNIAGSGNVGGGFENTVASFSTANGKNNKATGLKSVAMGGRQNKARASTCAVGGGESNVVSGKQSVVGGGKNNIIGVRTRFSAIPGGKANMVKSESSVALGGFNNRVEKGAWSIAAGQGARSLHRYSAIFNLQSDTVASTRSGEFFVSAAAFTLQLGDGAELTLDSTNIETLRSLLPEPASLATDETIDGEMLIRRNLLDPDEGHNDSIQLADKAYDKTMQELQDQVDKNSETIANLARMINARLSKAHA